MPVYEFFCDDCRLMEETFRKISERDEPFECPDCKTKMRRVFSFRGSDSMSSLYPFERRFGTKKVVIHNRAEKLRMFRENDLYEFPTNYVDDWNLSEI